MQRITTTGNATIIAYDGKPVLTTDPWIGDEEPAYFGSWVLSHRIPAELKKDMYASEYVWFSHGHPDHLNPDSIQRFKSSRILLPDHVNGRILRDLEPHGYRVTVLPDRRWVSLSDNIRIQCITTIIQDAILLIDICGKLFINLNDAGTRLCTRYIRSIAKRYKSSFLLALAGYGDADMINFFDEGGSFIVPPAAAREPVGKALSEIAQSIGAKTVIPFSSFHQYQRADSIWAQAYTTPLEAYAEGMSPGLGYIAPFSSIDCRDLAVERTGVVELPRTVKPPEAFGDNWSDELEAADKKAIEDYFVRKDRIRENFGFLTFRVGDRDFTVGLAGPRDRGISFAVPRHSLVSAVDYRIFDDLLIGNFMKTTLHGLGSLYAEPGNFNFTVAKYGDNGMAEAEADLRRYEQTYQKRGGADHLIESFRDRSRDFLIRFASKDSRIFRLSKSLYESYLR